MAGAPAFQLYAGDFLVDTADWTLSEMGLYCRLLYLEWANGPLPTDWNRLARATGTDSRTLQKCWRHVSSKFVHTENGENWINLRLEGEREKQRQYREKQSKKGKKRAEKMWEGHIAVAITTAKPVLQPEDSSSSSSSISPIVPFENSIAKNSNGHVPHQEILAMWKEIIPEKPYPKAWPPERQTLLRNRWVEDPKRQTLDYWRRLFTFVRESPFLMGEEQSQGRDPFRLTLPWLLKRANFLKVIERNYHS